MIKPNNKTIIIIVIGLLVIFLLPQLNKQSKKEAGESFVRGINKMQVFPGETFTATYTATSSDTEWFVGFHEDVSCGNAVEGFILSNAGQSPKSEQYIFTAPQSGACTFSNGYSQFTGLTQQFFAGATISVCQHNNYLNCNVGNIWYYDSCNRPELSQEVCSGLVSNGTWGAWSCTSSTVRGRVKTDTIKSTCTTGQTICPTTPNPVTQTETCIGFCEQSTGNCQSCNTNADNNPCNSCVSFTELLSYANAWVAKTGSPVPTFTNVLQAANAWIGRNKLVC